MGTQGTFVEVNSSYLYINTSFLLPFLPPSLPRLVTQMCTQFQCNSWKTPEHSIASISTHTPNLGRRSIMNTSKQHIIDFIFFMAHKLCKAEGLVNVCCYVTVYSHQRQGDHTVCRQYAAISPLVLWHGLGRMIPVVCECCLCMDLTWSEINLCAQFLPSMSHGS